MGRPKKNDAASRFMDLTEIFLTLGNNEGLVKEPCQIHNTYTRWIRAYIFDYNPSEAMRNKYYWAFLKRDKIISTILKTSIEFLPVAFFRLKELIRGYMKSP